MAFAGETPEEKAERLREEKEQAEFAKSVKNHGLQAVYKELAKKLNAWRDISINIAVIGQAGSGKSTFVNTARRLKPSDREGAPSDVVESTAEPTSYNYPGNPMVKLWDLPGVGTAAFPRSTYLKQIQFERYDFFLVLSQSRFTEDDMWFAKEIRKRGKRFYFIRTKVDLDVRNNGEDYTGTHNTETLLKKIRDNCINGLSQSGITEPVVFRTGKNYTCYDFSKFQKRLIAELPEIKHEAALLTLKSTSRDVIVQKADRLRRRAWMTALSCVIFDTKRIERLSVTVNIKQLSEELEKYKSVLGLDNNGLRELSDSAKVPKEYLIKPISGNFWLNVTEATLIDAMAKTRDERASSSKRLDLPVIGFIANCAPSYRVTKAFLCKTITDMQLAMANVLDTAFSNASPQK